MVRLALFSHLPLNNSSRMSALIFSLLAISIATASAAPTACEGCQCCEQSLITVTTAGSGAHPFDSDVTDNSGECAVRTFTCKGGHANIEVNDHAGVVAAPPGGTEVKFEVTCNAAGTAWVWENIIDITKLECASDPF